MTARIVVILFFVLLTAPAFAAQDSLPPESLPKLLDAAISNNPDLRSAAIHVGTLKSRARQAGSLDDPMLMLKIQNGLINDPLNFSKDAMTQKVIGISQQLPFFGKRALREEVANKEAEAFHYTHEEKALELIRQVKEAYYQLYFTDRSLAIVLKNIGVLDTFITLAETKYSVGQGAQQDVYKAQLERSKMLDMQISLEQQRKSLEIALNSLLYRPATQPVGPIPEPVLKDNLPPAKTLVDLAEQNRPALKNLKTMIERWESSYRLARMESYPDFNVSFEYMQRDRAMGSNGDDMYSLGVTFNLPVRKERRQALQAESTSEINMTTEDLNAARNIISSGIADLLVQMERRKKLIELYKTGIIPQAEQSLESATIGYRVNKVDFLTLLDSRVTLFNYEREYYDSVADYQVKRAQLEALVGKELE
ncbi:RND transporter [Geomonas sp. Red276]